MASFYFLQRTLIDLPEQYSGPAIIFCLLKHFKAAGFCLFYDDMGILELQYAT